MQGKILSIMLFITGIMCHQHIIADNIVAASDTVKVVKKKNLLNKLYNYFDESNNVKDEKRFDISFIGGPSYSGDTKLGLGLVASGLYRIDKDDLTLPPSNISIYNNFTTSGFFSVGIEGHTIFPKDKYRIDLDMFFSSMPSHYWGIGYNNGSKKDNYTKYTAKEFQVKIDAHKQLFNHFYLGVSAMAQHIRGSNMRDYTYLGDESRINNAIGGGLIVSYDTRDFIPNPYSGLYFKLEQNIYPNFLGTTHSFSRLNFTARYYKQVWKGGVLAFDTNGTFNNGSTPWSMLAQVGGARQMRGYMKGQYRDKKMVDTQVELRQHVYSRSGVAIWAGAGNAFNNFDTFQWNQTLPTVGVGYRWEFKNRVNIRLDYGVGKGQSSVYFNINEAF